MRNTFSWACNFSSCLQANIRWGGEKRQQVNEKKRKDSKQSRYQSSALKVHSSMHEVSFTLSDRACSERMLTRRRRGISNDGTSQLEKESPEPSQGDSCLDTCSKHEVKLQATVCSYLLKLHVPFSATKLLKTMPRHKSEQTCSFSAPKPASPLSFPQVSNFVSLHLSPSDSICESSRT